MNVLRFREVEVSSFLLLWLTKKRWKICNSPDFAVVFGIQIQPKADFLKEDIQKNAIFHHSDKIMALNRWGTRTRTRKDRTRICSVANYTIPQTFFVSRFPLDYGCKFTGFFHIYQTKVHFFWKKSLLLQNIPAKCPILSIFHLKIIIHHGCSAILHDHHFETISSRDKSIKCANRHRKRNCGQFPEFS